MKTITLLTSFFLTSIFVSGQISPIPEVGSQWTLSSYGMFGITSLDPEYFGSTEEVIINEMSFTKIGNGFFRENENKWFCIAEGDSIEHLLYDFNLEADDTMFFYNPFIDSTSEWNQNLRAHYAIVQSTEMIELENGIIRKKLNLISYVVTEDSELMFEEESIIGGIGSSQNIFLFGFLGEQLDDDQYELVCFHNENNELLYENPVDGTYGLDAQPLYYEDCDWSVGLDELSQLEPIHIFPNPFNHFINLNLPDLSGGFQLEVYNPLGQLLRFRALDKKSIRINFSDLEKGIYQLVIRNQNGVVFVEQVIKE